MTEKDYTSNSTQYLIKAIKKSYPGGFTLYIPELEIQKGEIIGIEGENGSGKSTLLRLLSFLENPDSGKIFFNGEEAKSENFHILREKVSILPQNPYLLRRTVFEQVAFPIKKKSRYKKSRVEIKKSVYKALSKVGLNPEEYTKRKWYELSGGESQRVALASRLVTDPDTIILDEPTTGCDKESTIKIKNTINEIWKNQKSTIIIASHDIFWLRSICRRIIRLQDGKIITSELENIIPGPWEKIGKKILKKVLPDGQCIYAVKNNPSDNNCRAAIKPTDIVLSTRKIDSISAQNTLKGNIIALYRSNPYDETIRVDIQVSDFNITSLITDRAIEQLKIYPGMPIYAIFKATAFEWV